MEEELKLANQLCFSTYNVNRLFGQFYEQKLKSFNLTFSQYLVLLALWEEDEQSVASIGRKLDLASNTLTPLLKRLENNGWIERIKSKTDKRLLMIKLTNKAYEQKRPIHEAIADCISAHFDIEEYERALTSMSQIETKLKQLTRDD